ncbi:hypothetical protein BCT64_16635, partial [Vibrio breoganii]
MPIKVNRIFKVLSFTAMMTFARMICGFVITKVVAVYTGPNGVALIGQYQSFITMANGVINSPVSTGIIRYTSENSEKDDFYISQWWRAGFYWSTCIYVIFCPLGLLYSRELSELILGDSLYYKLFCTTLLLLPISSFGTLINSIVNGKQLYRHYVLVGITSVIFSTIVMLTMLVKFKLDGALYAAAAQSALVGLVVLVMNIKFSWLRISYFIGNVSNQKKREIFNYLLMALTSAIVAPLSLIMVRNIIAANTSWSEVGEWQAVWKVSEVYLSVITLTLSTYYLPKLSSIKDNDLIKKEIFNTIKYLVPILTVISIAVYVTRDIIITVLYTKEFYNARELFLFQLIGSILKVISWLIAFPMITKGRTKIYICSEIFFTSSLVFLTYIFVNHFGIVGANMAYALNFLIYFIFVSS